MKVLGWDTSGKTGYLFLADFADELILRFTKVLEVDQRQHSEGLLMGIAEALESAGLRAQDLNLLGIGVGPGSFTGIRIGLTTARTFGQMLGISLVPVSSLSMIEAAVRNQLGELCADVLVILEACMGEVYVRRGRFGDADSVERVMKTAALPHFLSESGYSEASSRPVVVVLPENWRGHPVLGATFLAPQWSIVTLNEVQNVPNALARLVFENFKKTVALRAHEVQPVYLRVSDAELHLRAREKALRSPGVDG